MTPKSAGKTPVSPSQETVEDTRSRYRTFPFISVADSACDDGRSTTTKDAAGTPSIPNLVHYVWHSNNPAEFSLGFRFFVSSYSAHIHWRPERIYIHTNANPEAISRARDSGTAWTRRTLGIPGVEIKYAEALQVTQKGVEIKFMAHKADFTRLEALREYGGVYLDTDAIPLRDVADLRNSGFRNVIGQQLDLAEWNYLNNGVMMAAKNSNLMTIYHNAAHQFFDGEWDTASILLLTDLANRLASIPHEVLILQPQAFGPMSWKDPDVERLYAPTMDTGTAMGEAEHLREQGLLAGAIDSGTCRDVFAWMEHREGNLRSGRMTNKDEVDFSSSYVLHAFAGSIENVFGKDFKVDFRHVLARQSNYARAVYPAVWHAIQQGVIPRDEIS